MLDGKQDDLQEIKCECGFTVGFSSAGTNTQIKCIYCKSEEDFFITEFTGKGGYIFSGIPDDKSPWRRGLMHSRKQSIRWAYEDITHDKGDANE